MNDSNIKELNSQLEGIIMGENEFIKLKEKTKNYNLLELLDDTLKTIENHKQIIIEEISNLGGEATCDEGVWGKMIEIFNNFKEMNMNSDKKVLQTAIKGTEMGFKGILDLIIKENKLQDNFKNSLIEISNKYANHIKLMQEYLVTID